MYFPVWLQKYKSNFTTVQQIPCMQCTVLEPSSSSACITCASELIHFALYHPTVDTGTGDSLPSSMWNFLHVPEDIICVQTYPRFSRSLRVYLLSNTISFYFLSPFLITLCCSKLYTYSLALNILIKVGRASPGIHDSYGRLC